VIKNLFNDLGYLESSFKSKKFTIGLDEISDGLNFYSEFFIYKKNSKIKVFDRNCDHAGGKLLQKIGENKATCPVHGWAFDPSTGHYDNKVKKKELSFQIKENKIYFDIDFSFPIISKINSNFDNKTIIKFFNHAFLIVEGKNFKFATDPWAIGPAFNNGWWLKNKTESDWLKEVNSCDFIYLSHNHPDHLNSYTLSKISKKINIVVPKFQVDSMGGLLDDLGFKNILFFDFNRQYNFKESNLIITMLKSGDFRLDSGIYFSNGSFSSLLDVDSNSINFQKLPKVTLYGSSFAGGASGYPLMFENYTLNEKIKISKKKNSFLKTFKIKNLLQTNAKYFLPYAGSFEEKLQRDAFVKKYNKKIEYNDYKKILSKKKISLLDNNKFKVFEFTNEDLTKEIIKTKKYYKDKTNLEYLKEFKKMNNKIDKNFIENYFINSNFKDNLILIVTLTGDNFKKNYLNFKVDFSNKKIKFTKHSKIDSNVENNLKNNNRILYIKIRKESFINTIKHKQPWEDILIGFQCKIQRNPNIFNSKFWYHFSNIYIKNKSKKFYKECNTCDIFNQKIDSLLYHSNQ